MRNREHPALEVSDALGYLEYTKSGGGGVGNAEKPMVTSLLSKRPGTRDPDRSRQECRYRWYRSTSCLSQSGQKASSMG
jgi:hypothetical protein